MDSTVIEEIKRGKAFKDRLANGLTVVTVEQPHIHSLELAIFVRSGLRFENKKNNGVSHFLEHMLFRGNSSYPNSFQLNREFESIGRDLRASTMSDYTYYGFSPHVSNLARAMELFAIFFIEPTFPEIELERGIILEECLEDLNEQGVDVDINNLACKLLYKDDMLACPTIGTEDTIREVTVEMLREHFRTFYVPGNMVLAGAGRVDHDVFLKLASKHFSNLAEGGRVISNGHFEGSLDETQSQPEVLFQHDSDSQVQLQICFRSVSYNHPDYFVVNLIARIFDDGVTSRLQKILREERGLVYSVECRATSLPDTGTLDFDVSVRSEKVVEVTKILLGEVKTLVGSGAEDEELDCIKRRYGYDLDYEPDDPYKQIMRYGFCHLYSREYSAEEERESIGRITTQDIQRVARKIFIPENLNFVLVGPHIPQLKKELEDIVRNF